MNNFTVMTHKVSFGVVIASMADLSDDQIIDFILELDGEHLELSSTKELIKRLQEVVDRCE